ncbi:N-6 DNA methylase [Actinomycetota bacterium]
MERHSELTNFIWSVADLLRHDYKQSEYGRVILPLTVLRRLDCVLEPTKDQVLAEYEKYKGTIDNIAPILNNAAGQTFYNTSKYNFTKLLAETGNLADATISYINGFSDNARVVLEKFDFPRHIKKLEESNLLFVVLKRFETIDLHPDTISNTQMGYIYEELIRRFSEQSNETAGEHFTPREVIEMMVNLLFAEDDDLLRTKGVVRTMYDPACGTGGMLTVAERHLGNLNSDASLELFGQEINPETYATCVSDMMLKGNNPDNIIFGNTFTDDGLSGKHFDYMLCNPPFGVDWKKYRQPIEDEHTKLGFDGRFGAGTPRVSDGSLLFLQHMISKMKPAHQGGSRLAIVFNASPLFTGSAGSGESEIRRWIIENDWLEAIVALPDQLFYNTGISTYVWMLSNRKRPERQGKIQLIDGRQFFHKMRKGLGEKRNELGPDDIDRIAKLYGDFAETKESKVFDNGYFGYRRVVVELPRRYRYHITNEAIEVVKANRYFDALTEPPKKAKDPEAVIAAGEKQQRAILTALESLQEFDTTDPKAFEKQLKKVLNAHGAEASRQIIKAIVSGAAERDEAAPAETDSKGNPIADTNLRDNEHVPLTENMDEYVEREVLPYFPDAWVDESKTRVGYEISFTREFYEYVPPRPLEEIDAEIESLESEILGLLDEVSG